MALIPLYMATAVNRAEFEQLLAESFSDSDRDRIMRAYSLAKVWHGHYNEPRRDGSRYFEHPKAVAVMLLKRGVTNATVVCAALLHDVVEDCYVSLATIEAIFGAEVRLLVDLLTHEKEMSDEQYFARLLASDEPGAWLGKLADRTHNLSTLTDSDDPAKQEVCRRKKVEQVAETRQFVLPLAVALSQCPGYESQGRWFVAQVTAWCHRREREAKTR